MATIDNRSFLGKLLRLPLKLIPSRMVMTIKQGPCRGMKWIAGASTHGCWLGTYELEKQKILEKFIGPGRLIYDIGANAGIYTLLFSKLVGENGRVFAFEPLAENANNLLKHIRLNKINNVTLVQTALADKAGLSYFLTTHSNSMGFITHKHTQLKIATFSIDDLVKSYGFPIPDLIKMDVEGAESSILNGMQSLLEKKKSTIFIALHSNEQKRLCQEILFANGYQLFCLNGAKIEDRIENLQDDEIYAMPINDP